MSTEITRETQELLKQADARFKALLSGETSFPDRIGIVLAAGAATRFRPLTASKFHAETGELENKDHYSVITWNKASLPIVDHPLIDGTIEDLVGSGFRYIIVNVSKRHAAESIIRATSDSRRFGDDVAIMFLVEERPSGTYGGVTKMLRYINQIRTILPSTDVAIFSGDIYTEQSGYEILQFHRRRKSAFTLMLNPVPEEVKDQFGIVEIDDEQSIIGFHEKKKDAPTNLNNSSRYIARYELLARWADRVTEVPLDKNSHRAPECFFDFGLHIFSRNLGELQQAGFLGFVSDKMWADLGRIYDFHAINIYTLKNTAMTHVHPEAIIEGHSVLEGNYNIAAGATIRSGSTIRDSIVGPGWVVDGASLNQTVLMPLPEGFNYEVSRDVMLSDCVVGCGNIKHSYDRQVIVFNGEKNIITPI
ncbi:MAG: sugar phosphate nucleotidyltransferase [Myxococcota bacterium]|nr:sugar phosphate nucleotidyltransferase [Myxococcota bacterium]